MTFFPLKTAILCLVLTPVLYTLALTGTQQRLSKHYLAKIQNVMIHDAGPLLERGVAMEEWIGNNINSFLANDWLIQAADLDIAIFVTTGDGVLIYPRFSDTDLFGSGEFKDNISRDSSPREENASDNYRRLIRGLKTIVEIRLTHGSRIANLILACFVLVSVAVLTWFYRSGRRQAKKELDAKTVKIKNLEKGDQQQRKYLADLKREKQDLFDRMRQLDEKYRGDQDKAKITEEELFEEIIHLEDELSRWQEAEKEKEREIETLKTRLRKFERRKSGKARRNEFDFLSRRLTALYKNIRMNRKAVSGMLNLNEEQQIKAEEVIFQLDQNPDMVIVKRKVFAGKKQKAASFEVLFAYNGRLYFRPLEGKQVEILIIGTKNTQSRDMEFLHNI